HDVIIIGAGSIGVPTALSLAQAGQKVCVLEALASPGQGENKHAIGGIRATHTTKSKILTCLKSLEIFSTWEKKYGEDIEWLEGGYCFVVYTEDHERILKEALPVQHSYGLKIDWVQPEKIQELVPGINTKNLRGGTFSPHDGNASTLVSINSFYRQAINDGAEFKLKEKVIGINSSNGDIKKIKTNKGEYKAEWVVNAAGTGAGHLGRMLGLKLPVVPDSHEAGVTEPVKHFLDPMVVDLRSIPGSKNYYFYQDKHGSLVFCITPQPLIVGTDTRSTSVFLPQIAKRMIDLVPRLRNIKIRRIWRGLYPMTPDGSPIVGTVKEIKGYINAVGMCGQGFMLGPGLGELIARITTGKLSSTDREILEELSLYRDFGTEEKLK
ncbi:MAG: NAD(P)/FAD-dependent oxidoreductase, partial [Candidatus Hodarchaeota archaeon]